MKKQFILGVGCQKGGTTWIYDQLSKLEQVDFGQLDYSSEEPMIISITMKPEQGEGSVIVTTETIK